MKETKLLNMKISGKNGETNTHTIQRHKPLTNMLLIILESGNSLFCQKNHPLIICSDNINVTNIPIEAKDLKINDFIYINNSICFNQNDYQPNIKPKQVFETIKHINSIDDEYMGPYVYGNKFTCYLDPNFINYNIIWLKEFLNFFIKEDISSTYSYNLLQQLFLISLRCEFKLDITFVDLNNKDVKFYFKLLKNIKRTLMICGKSKVVNIFEINNWNQYVYDIKTDTNEYMLGCTQTHNSFHTGGLVKIHKIDIIKEFLKNLPNSEEKFINSIIKQIDEDVFAKLPELKIFIIRKIFKNEYKIEDLGDKYKLPLGYFTVKFKETVFDVNTEQEVYIYKTKNLKESENEIVIEYDTNEKIAYFPSLEKAPEKTAVLLDALMSGKSPYKNSEQLYLKFYDNLHNLGDWDSVHLEVIISNILRCKTNPRLPARLKEPYQPVTFSNKILPSIISPNLGMMFENINRSIIDGMVNERSSFSTDIEKVFISEPLSDLSKKILTKK